MASQVDEEAPKGPGVDSTTDLLDRLTLQEDELDDLV